VLDVAAGRQRIVSLLTEWDEAGLAGPGLAGVRRNEIVRNVFASVAADLIDGQVLISVTPTEAWSPLFETLVPEDRKAKKRGWRKVADVFGSADGPVVAVVDGATEGLESVLQGSGAQANASAPMLPVNPWA